MINFRWSAITGGAAFALSLLIGLISGAGFYALLRACIFGTLFFLLGSGVYWVINIFLSEIFEASAQNRENASPRAAAGSAGSKIDISLEGDDGFSSANIGFDGFSDLASDGDSFGALDQDENKGYNSINGSDSDPGESSLFNGNAGPNGAGGFGESAIPIDGLDSIDTLPDLEGGMFQALEVEETIEDIPSPMPTERRRTLNSAKPAELQGDYKPQEIAQAIQTILKRE